MTVFVQQLASDGFAIVPTVLSPDAIGALEQVLPRPSDEAGGIRNLLAISEIAALAASPAVRALIDRVLGRDACPVRGIRFDKTPVANWKVSWHQDLTIAVKERREVADYGPWSEKAGVTHVQPPSQILEAMLAFRLHIDESAAANGPLRVLP